MTDIPKLIDKRIKLTIDELDKVRRRKAHIMPNEQAALNVLYMAWERLKDFGWNDMSYCPKDGTEFDVIELGSTGVFSGRYVGTWPNGMWETMDDSDIYPSYRPPAMFRLRKVRVKAPHNSLPEFVASHNHGEGDSDICGYRMSPADRGTP